MDFQVVEDILKWDLTKPLIRVMCICIWRSLWNSMGSGAAKDPFWERYNYIYTRSCGFKISQALLIMYLTALANAEEWANGIVPFCMQVVEYICSGSWGFQVPIFFQLFAVFERPVRSMRPRVTLGWVGFVLKFVKCHNYDANDNELLWLGGLKAGLYTGTRYTVKLLPHSPIFDSIHQFPAYHKHCECDTNEWIQ